METVTIYTDGSCHTQYRIGGWAAIIFFKEDKKYITGVVNNTTHNRMEIMAVLESIDFVNNNYGKNLTFKIFSDSQYVVDLPSRFEKLAQNNFITKKGMKIQNADLVKELTAKLSTIRWKLIKVKAHEKINNQVNYNIDVDKLARELVRKAVKELI